MSNQLDRIEVLLLQIKKKIDAPEAALAEAQKDNVREGLRQAIACLDDLFVDESICASDYETIKPALERLARENETGGQGCSKPPSCEALSPAAEGK